ncbi:GumC family protein [Qipengyuania atrilutea]|uniref:Lipopolysaccharide biosynthesis protein n=1 Tax=Qipengyuania atrilutea TaxID=2744473 RepID=A0A850HER7_9SPHN|nr:Wzz/FepE/Etk N-terminal domain-containing protein [Actirhodobacter atriluteus]NVD45749.1 lipopolysaccharide biosynthesis protein [Actirhodobacter atriluteus]
MNEAGYGEEPTGQGFGGLFTQLPTILWERKWWIIIPSVLGIVAAIAATVLIEPLYKSDALMIVQAPQVQGEVFDQLNNEVIDQRIARIREEVTSRPNLVSLIERHRLYVDERQSQPLSAVIEKMRENIELTPTRATAPSNRDAETIAFQLSFFYEEAQPSQAVAQDLMDSIIELDASGNVEQATNTVQFLTDQSAELETRINEIETQIAEISARNGGALAGGGGIVSSGTGSYDVQIAALQRENSELVAQRNRALSADQRDPGVLAAEAALANARATYSESHPDVVLAKQRLAEARQLAKQNVQLLPFDAIDRQISFNNTQIAQLRAVKAQEQAQLNSRLAAQSRAPLVQQQITSLQQDLSGLNSQYQNVQVRLTQARAGVKAEDEQIAERLTVVEAPIVPDTPVWPNRLLIFALCVGGGLILGGVLAMAIELLFRPIRDPDSLGGIVGEKPLAVVPIIDERKTAATKRGFGRFIPAIAGRR